MDISPEPTEAFGTDSLTLSLKATQSEIDPTLVAVHAE